MLAREVDVSRQIKNELVSLLKFKSKCELEIIRDWLNGRIEKDAATPQA